MKEKWHKLKTRRATRTSEEENPAKPEELGSMRETSGSAESSGGSREGNAGHQSSPNSGRGHRQL